MSVVRVRVEIESNKMHAKCVRSSSLLQITQGKGDRRREFEEDIL